MPEHLRHRPNAVQRARASYHLAMERLILDDPDAAAAVSAYVGFLSRECAERRAEARHLRNRLEERR